MEHPEYNVKSSIQGDGSRPKILLANVSGFFTNLKPLVFYPILIIFFTIPLIRFSGERWFLLNIENRIFTLFGFTFNAQDIYLIFFVVTGLGFSLFFITALFGRIWCGWTCPQTVLLEGVFRKIEQFIEGTRSQQMKLYDMPWNAQKLGKFMLKHVLFIITAILVAVGFISYFVPQAYFFDLIHLGLGSHPIMLTWLILMSFIIYGNFAWFREQLCLIICPYGRFQSALTDDNTIVIGYDEGRGEPRGKLGTVKGDCIDCGRCQVVCPTGIDIRKGLQMECIGCANCIDACDDIMLKVGKAPGLIRYDSLNGLSGRAKQFFRPRLVLYSVLMLVGMLVFGFTLSKRNSFEASVLRLPGSTYSRANLKIQNNYEVHIFNKSNREKTYTLNVSSSSQPEIMVTLPFAKVKLPAFKDRRVPFFIELFEQNYVQDFTFEVEVVELETENKINKVSKFLGGKP